MLLLTCFKRHDTENALWHWTGLGWEESRQPGPPWLAKLHDWPSPFCLIKVWVQSGPCREPSVTYWVCKIYSAHKLQTYYCRWAADAASRQSPSLHLAGCLQRQHIHWTHHITSNTHRWQNYNYQSWTNWYNNQIYNCCVSAEVVPEFNSGWIWLFLQIWPKSGFSHIFGLVQDL